MNNSPDQLKVTLFWFRRDLRLEDNTALFHALKDEYPVQPVFIFDRSILDELPSKDARVEFIHQEITRLSSELKERNSCLDVRYGKPLDIWKDLLEEYDIGRVYANRDYEPYARKRDKEIYELLESKGIRFIGKKDQVIFEKNDVLKKDGDPYTVYTPYSRVWKANLGEDSMSSFPSEEIQNWNKGKQNPIPSLSEMDFEPAGIEFPSRKPDTTIIRNYHKTRNFPSKDGTTRLSIHLRFGTISIRKLAGMAHELNEKYFNELIWREFYMAILWHFPDVVDHNFNRKYDGVQWRNNDKEFQAWCEGRTGYPIVDAGMRELNTTGYMHNRVRMIVSSFLTKHLLIDWKWGEAYFAKKLLDYELASNNGGWQWAAGTGVDAAPYFRIFNPYTQTDKFDKDRKYIRDFIPEIDSPEYPEPIVEHKAARERALQTYKAGLDRSK
jgi:deoxyribodipyrimidine photo-lyase